MLFTNTMFFFCVCLFLGSLKNSPQLSSCLEQFFQVATRLDRLTARPEFVRDGGRRAFASGTFAENSSEKCGLPMRSMAFRCLEAFGFLVGFEGFFGARGNEACWNVSWLVFYFLVVTYLSDVRYVRFNPHAHGEANSTFLEIPCYPRGVSSFFCSKFLPKFNLISVKKYPPKNHLKMDGKRRRPFPFWGKRPIFRGELAVSFRGGSILNQFPTSMCELTSNHGTAIQLCHACFVDLLDLQVVVEKTPKTNEWQWKIT